MPLKTSVGILTKIGGRIVASMATKHMLVWGLRLLAKRTETKIDDKIVDLVDAGLNGTDDEVREAGKALITKLAERFGPSIKN